MTFSGPSTGTRRLADKWKRLHWGIITVLCWLAAIGVVMHLSVAGDAWNGQPLSHGARFAAVLAVALMLAMIDLRFWLAIAYPLYVFSLLLLVAVDLIGAVHMGAQRWLDIGPLSLQPSEIMKVALVLALARYYHQLDAKIAGSLLSLIPPLLMIAAPTALVMKQPDLGTSLLLAGAGFGLMFLAGIRWRYIVIGALIAGAAGFWAYEFKLQDYQRDRIATFLDPEADPLGAGYHVAQSKIAIGSAGLLGQGYQKGSQSQLDNANRWFVDVFSRLVARLKDTPEGDGNILDNTAALYMMEGGKGLADDSQRSGDGGTDANHSVDNYVAFIAGRAGGLVPGQHVNLTGQDLHPSKMITTAFQAIGIEPTLGEISGAIDQLFG